jgi:hypothetical protein
MQSESINWKIIMLVISTNHNTWLPLVQSTQILPRGALSMAPSTMPVTPQPAGPSSRLHRGICYHTAGTRIIYFGVPNRNVYEYRVKFLQFLDTQKWAHIRLIEPHSKRYCVGDWASLVTSLPAQWSTPTQIVLSFASQHGTFTFLVPLDS